MTAYDRAVRLASLIDPSYTDTDQKMADLVEAYDTQDRIDAAPHNFFKFVQEASEGVRFWLQKWANLNRVQPRADFGHGYD